MIRFNLIGATKLKIRYKKIERILKSTEKILKIKSDYTLSIVLVDKKKIRNLNKIYRRKNRITDILTFCYKDKKTRDEKFYSKSLERDYLGEIIIYREQLLKQAMEHKYIIEQEFCSLLVHGLLHLFGYDHHRKKDRERMEKMENLILKKTFGYYNLKNSKFQVPNSK